MNYKQILEKSMPVTFDDIGVEDGEEMETLWLADMVDGKWVEDFVKVRRTTYVVETDEVGAVYALIMNGKMLVKAPNVKYYRIPESVYRIAKNAFRDCSEIEELDVPYSVSEVEIEPALKRCDHQFKVQLWDWPYNNARSEQLEKEIAEGVTDEFGFVYSRDRKRLLKAANVKTYWIPEGVEEIDRLAFVHCVFETLHVPYTCKIDNLPAEQCPVFGSDHVQGSVVDWDRPYSEEDEIEDSLYTSSDDRYVDEKGVIYTPNKKRLLGSKFPFNDSEYHVPDCVQTICSNAFAHCEHFLALIVPSTVKVIGDSLFGKEGGKIIIRS